MEQTRFILDETFNYSVIKLLVNVSLTMHHTLLNIVQLALNEQYMVAGTKHKKSTESGEPLDSCNRVLAVLKSRFGSSKTFVENMIFMLNRACTFPFVPTWLTCLIDSISTFGGRSFHAAPGVKITLSTFHF